ncbi:hypothetical protein TTHERM_00753450 (macronuclear) [Tetrahymena thermophila SB210]|uniref:Zinc carboxypeptidase family protein n=1 Tax=Tetrahymena thermophila (strain SB210) TaxID=312017 RepID=Q23NH5_TETTS|nr:hypothetical protein TTHERM_00753450 [Tetrahymena thermophila SB210]EAR98099.2 hypothetical protein TTHERM_00753450 [Tetrahymena thermophila SB210]|eukprot:XP_001018344.2 hypothetical protein TTHERM_00753450 [Tetrahymena thermophila SB210]
MDQIAHQTIQNCQKHSNNQISFLRVNQISDQNEAQIFYCIDCVDDDHDFKGIDYIQIQKIIQQPQSQILQKWPPVNDNTILQKLLQQYQNSDTSNSVVQRITKYFTELKYEINIKIENVQKKILKQALEISFEKEQILQQYKQISQIDKLQQIFQEGKQHSFDVLNNQCKAFLTQIQSQKEEISLQLQNLLDQCCKVKQQADFDTPNKIRIEISSLLENIYFFPQLNQNNINLNYSNLETIMQLVSNKSNFCTCEFLDSLRKNLEKLNPFIEQMEFVNIFQQGREPIKFQEISETKFEEINEFMNHLINLENSQQYSQQIQQSERIQNICKILENKTNFINQNTISFLKGIFSKCYPLMKSIDQIQICDQQEEFNCFQELSDDSLQHLIKLINLKKQFEIRNNFDESETNAIRHQAKRFLYDFKQNELDQILKTFPVFDLIPKENKTNILRNIELVKSDFVDGVQRIQIVKNSDESIEAWINQQQYSGKYKNYAPNCIWDSSLEKEKKYVFRIQFNVNNENSTNFILGLMQKSDFNQNYGYKNKLSCCLKYEQRQIKYKGGYGIDKLTKGDSFRLNMEDMIEMRVWLEGQILEIVDFPNYQYKLELKDELKNNLIDLNDLNLYFYLYYENIKYILKEAFIVNQFIN